MSPDNFNKDFARPFTRECVLYSPTEEYRHGNLLFMQFGRGNGEMKPIAIAVSKKMFQSQLVSRIIRVLKNNSLPQIELLRAAADNLIDEFNSHIQQEPYASTFCNELVHILGSFQELTNSLNTDFCGQVSKKLKAINACIHNPDQHMEIDGSYMYEVINQIEFYLKDLLTYYYHFLIVRQQENENGKGIGLTTQVADYLWELIGIIETVSDNIEDVLDMLLTWEVSMEMSEEQALNN